MLLLTTHPTRRKYKKLIDYLAKNCDVFSFCIPNFNKEIVTEKNKHLFLDREIGFFEIENDNCFHKQQEKIKSKIRNIQNDIIETYTDVEYMGTICNYEHEIYIVKITDNTKKFLLSTNKLFLWRVFSGLPEDLCFFKDHHCFMRSIAHEEICFIFDDSEKTKEALNIMKLNFWDDGITEDIYIDY